MKKIDKYICKNFIKSFLISLIAFINIFVLSQLFKTIRYVTAGRMTVQEAGLYTLYLLPKIIIEVSPLAVLLGSLMTINKMATNLEIISLKTSGISFRRIIRYPVIITIFISFIIFQLNDKVFPKTLEQSRILRDDRQPNRMKLAETKKNAFLRTKENTVYYIKEISRITNIGNNIEILKINEKFNEIEEIILAKSGRYNVEKKIWELADVVVKKNKLNLEEKYKTYQDKTIDVEPKKFISIQADPEELTNDEIRDTITKLNMTGGNTKEFLSVLANRYSFPFASLIVSFLGLALGSRYVRGASAISIGISIVLGYGYYIVQAIFEVLSVNGGINPFVSAWLPNIIFLCFGIYFIKKAEY